MKNFFSKLILFWSEDRSLTVMLLLLLLFIFVFVPILSIGKGGQIFIKIIYSILLLTGILSVAKHKTYVVAASMLAVIGLFLNWLAQVKPLSQVLIANDFSVILFSLFFAILVLIKTFQPGDITFHRIEGSIVVYLFMGLVFAFTFHAIYLIEGSSSFNNIRDRDIKEFLYFSFTSLTTMGYGDITPVNSLARSFANLEGLVGQLYPAILIARLVSMEFESSSRRKKKSD